MAVLYLDSSALVKIYAAEDLSGWTIDLVNGAGIPSDVFREAEDDLERRSRILDARAENVVAVSAIAWVECCAAFAAKERVMALTEAQRVRAEEALARDLRGSFLVRPVSGTVLQSAATLAAPYALRAYDAVQLATALVLRDETYALAEARRHAADDDELDPDEVLMLSFDRDLHAAAVETGIAHARPDRAGGRTFLSP